MYFTCVHTGLLSGVRETLKVFSQIRSNLKVINRDTELYYTGEGYFYEDYKPEYLEEGAKQEIAFRKVPTEISIDCRINLEKDDEYYYHYDYSVNDKSLTSSSNDPNKDKEVFLYEIFLKDWFDANTSRRVSINNFGRVEIIKK